jgi:hypothetical protein
MNLRRAGSIERGSMIKSWADMAFSFQWAGIATVGLAHDSLLKHV